MDVHGEVTSTCIQCIVLNPGRHVSFCFMARISSVISIGTDTSQASPLSAPSFFSSSALTHCLTHGPYVFASECISSTHSCCSFICNQPYSTTCITHMLNQVWAGSVLIEKDSNQWWTTWLKTLYLLFCDAHYDTHSALCPINLVDTQIFAWCSLHLSNFQCFVICFQNDVRNIQETLVSQKSINVQHPTHHFLIISQPVSSGTAVDRRSGTAAWTKCYGLDLDYMLVANKAARCDEHATALLYVERWADEQGSCYQALEKMSTKFHQSGTGDAIGNHCTKDLTNKYWQKVCTTFQTVTPQTGCAFGACKGCSIWSNGRS